LELILPGDMSAAAFIIVAALITPGSEVNIKGVGLNPTRTGLLDALEMMGADIEISGRADQGGEPVGDMRVRHSTLTGVQVDGELVVRMIDEFPAFAVAAAYARGATTVREAAELRLKESDRISALCGELASIGVDIEEKPDGFVIMGERPPMGGRVSPHGDHRLGMSLAIAGLASQEPVNLQDAAIIGESFPEFSTILKALGANIRWEQ
jgi:3-phosphoshikimate 1-carboxyvinyltransferase